ncbi:MAG: hypothetical protein UT33_C0009G0061 [Candidatus Peregrinibacteria bacterium GW2011_GWC2_39_14]|nr:MAG: hypothetical protein US92_C0005G0061 [Candidatus Peregrinibacteria bacterium GW2011_GWA2_38_36]KKR06610.1 MAG: hypothetical protein UT33_C0009G0061 [Candidatus Peregrinibacteria bacterium GW2011_GWC2_39_14]
MKKIISFIACALFFIPSVSFGASLVSGQNVDVKNPILENAYILGQNLNIGANLNGDFVGAGANINIENDIKGNVIAAGANINITSNVTGSVRLATGKAIITGVIGGDLFVMGSDVYVAKNTVINGDLIVFAGNLRMDGVVYGNIQGSVNSVLVRGTVGKSIKMDIGSYANFSNDSRVSGDFVYSSAYTFEVPNNVILGTIKHNPVELSWRNKGYLGITAGEVYNKFMSFLGLVLFALIFCLVAPNEVTKTKNIMRKNFFKSLGIGFLMTISMPVAMIIFFVSMIGVPIGLILGALFIIAIYVSKIFVAAFVSGFIFKDTHSKWAIFGKLTLGLFILMIVSLIPYVGSIVAIVLFFPAFGAIAMRKYEVWKLVKDKK